MALLDAGDLCLLLRHPRPPSSIDSVATDNLGSGPANTASHGPTTSAWWQDTVGTFLHGTLSLSPSSSHYGGSQREGRNAHDGVATKNGLENGVDDAFVPRSCFPAPTLYLLEPYALQSNEGNSSSDNASIGGRALARRPLPPDRLLLSRLAPRHTDATLPQSNNSAASPNAAAFSSDRMTHAAEEVVDEMFEEVQWLAQIEASRHVMSSAARSSPGLSSCPPLSEAQQEALEATLLHYVELPLSSAQARINRKKKVATAQGLHKPPESRLSNIDASANDGGEPRSVQWSKRWQLPRTDDPPSFHRHLLQLCTNSMNANSSDSSSGSNRASNASTLSKQLREAQFRWLLARNGFLFGSTLLENHNNTTGEGVQGERPGAGVVSSRISMQERGFFTPTVPAIVSPPLTTTYPPPPRAMNPPPNVSTALSSAHISPSNGSERSNDTAIHVWQPHHVTGTVTDGRVESVNK